MTKAVIRNIFLLWLGWSTILLSFQNWSEKRLDLKGPDAVLEWTAEETWPGFEQTRYYLSDPFMNSHVAWDSEYYLSIAAAGYDDPKVQAVAGDYSWQNKHFCTAGRDADCYSLNYAFFPLYPWLTRVFALALKWLPLGITWVGKVTLAAVMVSLLGTLAALFGLYSLLLPHLGEEGAYRALFFMLIFPSGFFLAQVYTEGLFLGLTFTALAFLQKRKWVWVALAAGLAAWTRPGGAILLLPMAVVWWRDRCWQTGWKNAIVKGLAAITPALSYGVWALTPLAQRFHLVEDLYFGRGLLSLDQSRYVWESAYQYLFSGANPQTVFYYSLEFIAVLLTLAGCWYMHKRAPELALYGLAMTGFAVTSGAVQGMQRYMLAVPCLFALLAHWGGNRTFERLWTLVSTLLLGLEVLLFTFNFWVA